MRRSPPQGQLQLPFPEGSAPQAAGHSAHEEQDSRGAAGEVRTAPVAESDQVVASTRTDDSRQGQVAAEAVDVEATAPVTPQGGEGVPERSPFIVALLQWLEVPESFISHRWWCVFKERKVVATTVAFAALTSPLWAKPVWNALNAVYIYWDPTTFELIPQDPGPPLEDVRFRVQNPRGMTLEQLDLELGGSLIPAPSLACQLPSDKSGSMTLVVPAESFGFALHEGQEASLAIFLKDTERYRGFVRTEESPLFRVHPLDAFDPMVEVHGVIRERLGLDGTECFVGPQGVEVELPELVVEFAQSFRLKLDGRDLPVTGTSFSIAATAATGLDLPGVHRLQLFYNTELLHEVRLLRYLDLIHEMDQEKPWQLSPAQSIDWSLTGGLIKTKEAAIVKDSNGNYRHTTLSRPSLRVPLQPGLYWGACRFRYIQGGSVSILLSKDILEATFPFIPGTGTIGLTLGRDAPLSTEGGLFDPMDAVHHWAVVMFEVTMTPNGLLKAQAEVYIDGDLSIQGVRRFHDPPRDIYISLLQRGAADVEVDRIWLGRVDGGLGRPR